MSEFATRLSNKIFFESYMNTEPISKSFEIGTIRKKSLPHKVKNFPIMFYLESYMKCQNRVVNKPPNPDPIPFSKSAENICIYMIHCTRLVTGLALIIYQLVVPYEKY